MSSGKYKIKINIKIKKKINIKIKKKAKNTRLTMFI